MSNVLIIGASRGIGLEFVRQYRAAGERVIATARSEDALAKLRSLGAEAHKLDVLDTAAIAALGKTLAHERIDLIVVNAGVMGIRTQGIAANDPDDFDFVMRTNVRGPMHLTAALAPTVVAARGKIAYVSSRMGSIELATGHGSWLYRASKGALNVLVKIASTELGPKGVTFVTMHPGYVRTDMSGPQAAIDADESVRGMRKVIAEAGPEKNGHFINYDGEPIPW